MSLKPLIKMCSDLDSKIHSDRAEIWNSSTRPSPLPLPLPYVVLIQSSVAAKLSHPNVHRNYKKCCGETVTLMYFDNNLLILIFHRLLYK